MNIEELTDLLKPSITEQESFRRLADIVAVLRGPDGCPWDREQTMESLGPQLLEEVYEVIDAVKNNDIHNIREELGDVYLVVTMIARILNEHQNIPLHSILDEVSDKLIRRHPHVFSDQDASTPEEVVNLWNSIKITVEGKERKDSILSSVRKSLPPLERAYKLQKKAAKTGFDWNNSHGVLNKIQEELDELREAFLSGNVKNAEDEMGDFLFSIINLCRFLEIDPAIALHRTNNKFISRFNHVEEKMKEAGYALSADNMEEMDQFWQEAKSLED